MERQHGRKKVLPYFHRWSVRLSRKWGFFHRRQKQLINPRSPYSVAKASSDHFVRAYHHTYGLPTVISNCSNNYGSHHFPEKLIPLAINNIKKKLPIPIYGKGENVRDWLPGGWSRQSHRCDFSPGCYGRNLQHRADITNGPTLTW